LLSGLSVERSGQEWQNCQRETTLSVQALRQTVYCRLQLQRLSYRYQPAHYSFHQRGIGYPQHGTGTWHFGYHTIKTDYYHCQKDTATAYRQMPAEVDEMRTFIGRKSRLRWIVYALDRKTKSVACFNVGRRTNRTLNVVITTLELSETKKIYTDKLKNYRFLIAQKGHNTALHATNHIERHNLTIRTHLKRLNRKTICFSRSLALLTAILKIYFWG
jgi:IS1 family transposase